MTAPSPSVSFRYSELNHGKMNARDRYGMRELEHLTTQTGGKSYEVHTMKVSQAFAEISGDTESPTSPPTRSATAPSAKIVIQPTRPGLVLRARAGYYAK